MELTQDLLFDETRYKQSLTFAVSQRQTWGDVRLNVQGSHFLHDFDRNNLDVGGFVSFRITRGLDVRFGGELRVGGRPAIPPLRGPDRR